MKKLVSWYKKKDKELNPFHSWSVADQFCDQCSDSIGLLHLFGY